MWVETLRHVWLYIYVAHSYNMSIADGCILGLAAFVSLHMAYCYYYYYY